MTDSSIKFYVCCSLLRSSFLWFLSLSCLPCFSFSFRVCGCLCFLLSFFSILSFSFFGNLGVPSVLWDLCWIRCCSCFEAILTCSAPTPRNKNLHQDPFATAHNVLQPWQHALLRKWMVHVIVWVLVLILAIVMTLFFLGDLAIPRVCLGMALRYDNCSIQYTQS